FSLFLDSFGNSCGAATPTPDPGRRRRRWRPDLRLLLHRLVLGLVCLLRRRADLGSNRRNRVRGLLVKVVGELDEAQRVNTVPHHGCASTVALRSSLTQPISAPRLAVVTDLI